MEPVVEETRFDIIKLTKSKFEWKMENYNISAVQSKMVELSDDIKV